MRILLAVDGSEYSAEAVKAVAGRPWPAGTTVRALTAVEPIVPPAAELWYDAGGDLERAQQEMTARAEQLTAGAAETLRAGGLTAGWAVRDGEPRSVIVDEAKEWDADLIVVGSHGYTGLKRWLLGSVAQSVVGHAPCSVEVVRRKQARSPEPSRKRRGRRVRFLRGDHRGGEPKHDYSRRHFRFTPRRGGGGGALAFGRHHRRAPRATRPRRFG